MTLPATSTVSPVTFWFAPSLVSRVSPAQPATPVWMPEVASEQVKVTATSVLFQPNPLAVGDCEPAIVGGVVSTLIGNEPCFSSLPASSTDQ